VLGEGAHLAADPELRDHCLSFAGRFCDPDRAMKIELLYFDGCPGYEALLPALPDLLTREGVEDGLELHPIETIEEAERERFLGSPTVRIDGEDVDPGAPGRGDFGLKCRLYRDGEDVSRTPPEPWIRAAVERARQRVRIL
jgi:hypothetical protein